MIACFQCSNAMNYFSAHSGDLQSSAVRPRCCPLMGGTAAGSNLFPQAVCRGFADPTSRCLANPSAATTDTSSLRHGPLPRATTNQASPSTAKEFHKKFTQKESMLDANFDFWNVLMVCIWLFCFIFLCLFSFSIFAICNLVMPSGRKQGSQFSPVVEDGCICLLRAAPSHPASPPPRVE